MSQHINLFNPAFQPQKEVLAPATMAIALGVLVAGIAVMGGVSKLRSDELQRQADRGATQLAAREARLAAVNAEFIPRTPDATIDAQIAEATAQLAAMRQISGAITRGELGDTSGFAGYFKAFARQSMPGLWLTGVTVAGGGAQIGIKGRSIDPASVPGYLNRLTHEPLMQGKSFSSLQIGEAAPLPAPAVDGQPMTRPAPYVEFSLQSTPEEPRP